MTLPASGPLAMTDIQTEFGGTNPIGLNEYYAGGGLVPPGTSGTYGAVPSSGALSIQNFYGTSNYIPVYIEDVFSTYLYAGNGTARTITNGIDLAGEGGLVWTKSRSNAILHNLIDTDRGLGRILSSNNTDAQSAQTSDTLATITGFTGSGYTLGADPGNWGVNFFNAYTYASWTFRKQPKFFDIVTYTGNGASSRSVSHSLGSVPGMVIYKNTTNTSNWIVNHRAGDPGGNYTTTRLNQTSANLGNFGAGNYTTTEFIAANIGTILTGVAADNMNVNGNTYVAYLFAHDAGGFGLTGTDNVISCRSVTSTAGGTIPTVDLGFEPQWILYKNLTNGWSWEIWDNMRGWSISSNGNATANALKPNLSNEESSGNTAFTPTGTGFYSNANFGASQTYIYIAIRRGPMEVPTLGTSVFKPAAWTGTSTTRVNTTGFVTDLNISRMRSNFSSGSNLGAYWVNRLTGVSPYLRSDATAAEAQQTNGLTSFASNTAVTFGADTTVQAWNFDNNYVNYSFGRAPGFFDEVCYTGNGTSNSQAHNLTVPPELVLIKRRNAESNWVTLYGFSASTYSYFLPGVNGSGASITSGGYGSGEFVGSQPTSTQLPITSAASQTNADFGTYVAYLFATCPGVSKVGSYTGNGSNQTINCGFAAGARFVMIKAASTTGNWVFSDVNLINPGSNDKALYMNNADTENNSYNWIDIHSTGFVVNETAVIAANTNGVTYIFLAIA